MLLWQDNIESKEKTHRSLHQPDICTLLTGCEDHGWSFLLHGRQYDSGYVPESAGLCEARSRGSMQLYLDSLPACDQHYSLGRSLLYGNPEPVAHSAWTSKSTQGCMEGLTHASSRWWYDLRSGHQLSRVHVPQQSESR